MVLMLSANLYLGVRKAITKEIVPKLLGFAPLIVISGSMEPAILAGDIVIIREMPPEAYAVGDVVSYTEAGLVYTHRIVRIEQGRLILKGDHNNVEDEPVARDQVLGQAVLVLPAVGRLVLWFRTPVGLGLLSLVLLAIVLYDRPAREKREKDTDS